MEFIEQVRDQFFGSVVAAAVFAFLVLFWRKNRQYHWPTTWFDIALVVGLALLALLPNGWNWLVSEPAQTGISYFQSAQEDSGPPLKALFWTDVIGTIIGAAIGAFGASKAPGNF